MSNHIPKYGQWQYHSGRIITSSSEGQGFRLCQKWKHIERPLTSWPKVLGSSSTASLLLGGKTGWIKFLNMAISGSKAVKHWISVKRSRVLTPLLPLCICQNILLNMGNYRSTMVELSPHHPKVKGSGFASSGSTVEDPSCHHSKVKGSRSTAPVALER